MAITYVKDIPDFNKKVNELTDITDVKDDIEDIQGDITEIQGDVTTLAGAVTALDEEVDGLSASNIPYSDTQSIKEKIDDIRTTVITLNPTVRSNITTATELNGLGANTTVLAFITYSDAPFVQVWATIRTLGNNVVKNQEITCEGGYAFRHYEGGNWSAWKKVNFS